MVFPSKLMDNLAAHKVKGVREAIEATGAKLVHQPPYSPDLNPIELCWSKLKAYLRAEGARSIDALNEAIGEAMDLITRDDCHGWFRHCGYPLNLSM